MRTFTFGLLLLSGYGLFGYGASGCYARPEIRTLHSPADPSASAEMVERVLSLSGYEPALQDEASEGERKVVATPWLEYPKGHDGHGPFLRRVAVHFIPQKAGGTDVALRIDVSKCVGSGTEARCSRVDMLFDSDKNELERLSERVQKAIGGRPLTETTHAETTRSSDVTKATTASEVRVIRSDPAASEAPAPTK